MIEAIILGIVQGVTEFLPVSSTAHLILFPWFFNWSGEVNTLTFDVALHAGATLLHFKKAFMSQGNHDLQLFATGIITSFITGFIAIKFLLSFLKKYPMNLFVYYRFMLAVVIIAGIWLKG